MADITETFQKIRKGSSPHEAITEAVSGRVDEAREGISIQDLPPDWRPFLYKLHELVEEPDYQPEYLASGMATGTDPLDEGEVKQAIQKVWKQDQDVPKLPSNANFKLGRMDSAGRDPDVDFSYPVEMYLGRQLVARFDVFLYGHKFGEDYEAETVELRNPEFVLSA